MTHILQTTTVNPILKEAQAAIQIMSAALLKELSITVLRIVANDFENTMNGLSGEILNLSDESQTSLQISCADIVANAANINLTISLFESLLPKNPIKVAAGHVITAKKLYPLTTSVVVEDEDVIAVVTTPEVTPEVIVDEEDIIDSIFDDMDTDAALALKTPMSLDQNETVDEFIPVLPSGMIDIAKEAADNVGGLQAGLTTFSYNPLAELSANTQELLLYYTDSNYANLNAALSVVYADPALNVEYKMLRESIGGPDGLSGAVAQLDMFKDHTDRLSGLIVDSESPDAEETGDSTNEFLNLNDFSGGPTVIFTFNARKFRSAKYMIQATAAEADRGHQTTEIYILHDNYQSYTREIASIYSQDPFVSFTTRLLNNKVEVLANTSASNTDFVIYGTKLRIARIAESFSEMSQTKIISNHETLQAYLNDGIDYVQLQSTSLLHPEAVANLGREFRDMLTILSSSEFFALSTALKQARILEFVTTIIACSTTIQSLINADYSNFLAIRRLAESLNIAYMLTQAYTDITDTTIPEITLNNATIQAIEAELS